MGGNNSKTVSIYAKDGHLIKDSGGEGQSKTPIIELSYENVKYINLENFKIPQPFKLDYCILDNESNGIEECAGLFRDPGKPINTYLQDFDQFKFVKSDTECYGYVYRPGLMFKEPFNAKKIFGDDVVAGKRCSLVFQDYNYNDKDQERCCFSDDKSRCNMNLTNDYTTNHCNIVMKEKCKLTPEDSKCILWLEKSNERNDNEAFELYMNYCSSNLNSKVCDYLCKTSRGKLNQNSKYCDLALSNYCTANPNNPNCHCFKTPSENIPNVETFLGPKECWLSVCSSQSEQKWLTTEQLDTRSKCQLTYCVISLDSLTLNDTATSELINDCISGPKINSAKLNNIKNNKTSISKKNNYFSFEILLLSSAMILLLLNSK